VSISRRGFLKASAAVGGAVGLGAIPNLGIAGTLVTGEPSGPVERARKPLNILILGGTGFTGPEQVEYAIKRGHSVTLINRNKTRPDFFKGRVEPLIGDMNGDMSALKGKKFDVVIDNPTTLPAWVRNVAQYMKGNTDHYIFISTISVYPDNSVPDADETAGLTPLPPEVTDPYAVAPTDAGKYYGALKSFSEKEVEKQYPGKNTIIRPGLIVGPLDRTDRFTYWPYRIDKGGEVLAPGTPNDPVQFIDARDIAEWTIRMAETRTLGTYNATGPNPPMTMGQMLNGIKAALNSNATFTWVPAEFLAKQKIRPWRDMTVWIPPVGETAGFMRRNISKAVSKGLTYRPLAVTARETLEWNKTRPAEQLQALAEGKVGGISAEREKQVLDAWKAEKPGH
jgi:2'-hydroxyisoflavone reductase